MAAVPVDQMSKLRYSLALSSIQTVHQMQTSSNPLVRRSGHRPSCCQFREGPGTWQPHAYARYMMCWSPHSVHMGWRQACFPVSRAGARRAFQYRRLAVIPNLRMHLAYFCNASVFPLEPCPVHAMPRPLPAAMTEAFYVEDLVPGVWRHPRAAGLRGTLHRASGS